MNNRHFRRIPFEAEVTLNSGTNVWSGELLDVAMRGAPTGKKAGARMKLVDCVECGHQISHKAEMCPQCGHSKKCKKWIFRGVIVTFAFFFIAYHEQFIKILHLPEMVDMVLHHLLGIPMDEGHH